MIGRRSRTSPRSVARDKPDLERGTLLARVWSLFNGGEGVGRRRSLPTLWDLLEWLEDLDLADHPFTPEELRASLARAMGVEIGFVSARAALEGQVENPATTYELLKGELMSRGAKTGGMVRDPLTESVHVLTPGDLRNEAELKPLYHELMHVALGDPVAVEPTAPYPEAASGKLRKVGSLEYWVPDSKLFPVAVMFDHEACEQRAEILAEYAVLASLEGGEALRNFDDHFWT